MTPFPFLAHGATLALAWFLALNLTLTFVVALAARRLTRSDDARTPAFWLALRLSPSVVSIAFTALVFLPSYWKYEPRDFVEGLTPSLAALDAVALALVAAALVRGAIAWRRASRRAAAWFEAARPLAIDAASIPVYELDIDAPIMALAGVLRPRLLVTRGVVDALTGDELRASVAHEIGHRRAWDNLKRLALRAAPDLLGATRAGRAIEQRWVAAAEQVADRFAGSDGPARCALASALVKVARLTPRVTPLTEPISTLVDGDDVTSRVRRLLDDRAAAAPRCRTLPQRFLAAAPAAAAIAAYAPLLRLVHAATEVLVQNLP